MGDYLGAYGVRYLFVTCGYFSAETVAGNGDFLKCKCADPLKGKKCDCD